MPIVKCKANCKHEYQDKKYNGMKVHNQTNHGLKCTVCGNEIRKDNDSRKK